MPLWLDRIEKQDFPLSDIGFSFLLAPYEEDKETHDILIEWFNAHPLVWAFIIITDNDVEHKHHIDGTRKWKSPDYNKMTSMRNQLMEVASSLEPDFFFSLDSDILLDNPSTISKLISLTDDNTAVSPLMYMRHFGTQWPSIMTWIPNDPANKAFRNPDYPIGTFFEADVIMAAVMMSKQVYTNTRYYPHVQGEDLGWSLDCKRKGFKLYSASDIYCPHIMHKEGPGPTGIVGPGILSEYLKTGDNRAPTLSVTL